MNEKYEFTCTNDATTGVVKLVVDLAGINVIRTLDDTLETVYPWAKVYKLYSKDRLAKPPLLGLKLFSGEKLCFKLAKAVEIDRFLAAAYVYNGGRYGQRKRGFGDMKLNFARNVRNIPATKPMHAELGAYVPTMMPDEKPKKASWWKVTKSMASFRKETKPELVDIEDKKEEASRKASNGDQDGKQKAGFAKFTSWIKASKPSDVGESDAAPKMVFQDPNIEELRDVFQAMEGDKLKNWFEQYSALWDKQA